MVFLFSQARAQMELSYDHIELSYPTDLDSDSSMRAK